MYLDWEVQDEGFHDDQKPRIERRRLTDLTVISITNKASVPADGVSNMVRMLRANTAYRAIPESSVLEELGHDLNCWATAKLPGPLAAHLLGIQPFWATPRETLVRKSTFKRPPERSKNDSELELQKAVFEDAAMTTVASGRKGVDTTIIQRGSTTVVSIDPSAKLNYALYEEGPPLEDCDLIATATTYPLLIRAYQATVKRMVELDKDLIAALKARGFKYDIGEDETGHQMKYRRRGGGYYLNAGCSDLIIDHKIGLLQFDDIEKFVPEGALMKDGTIQQADLLVLATGYYSQQEVVRRLMGDEVADRVGQVWGVGANGELANMWTRTPQEGLWFMGGALAQGRIYSKYVALQIKAIELGLM